MLFRNDQVVQSAQGQAIAGAQVYYCTQPAVVTTVPPSPLVSIFADTNGTIPLTQPVQTDGFGHAFAYMASGIYTIVVVQNGAISAVYTDQLVGTPISATGVSSVGLALPSDFVVTGSPITSGFGGTLTGTYVNQGPNTFLAGPTSGAAGAPSFRLLVASDIPALSGFVSTAPSADQTINAFSLLPASGNTSQALGSSSARWNLYANAVMLNNVIHVGGSIAGDIGAQVNAAYAALPFPGGRIVIDPKTDGTNYNFSTPIVLATVGKWVLLEMSSPGGATDVSSSGNCLNYTPLTATSAITLDYAVRDNSTFTGAHGLSNITLLNNQSFASGGQGSLAIGVNVPNTNGGCQGGILSNVAISGFGVGLNFINNLGPGCFIPNPQIFANTIGVVVDSATGLLFESGAIAGNGVAFNAFGASSSAELQFNSVQFYSNVNGIFDFSASTGAPVIVDCIATHFEAGSAASGAHHFIQGNCDAHIYGGLMEDANSTGTADWFVNTAGHFLKLDGVYFTCARPLTTIAIINSNTVAEINGFYGTTNISTYVTGVTSQATVRMQPFSGIAQTPWVYSAPISMLSTLKVAGQATVPSITFSAHSSTVGQISGDFVTINSSTATNIGFVSLKGTWMFTDQNNGGTALVLFDSTGSITIVSQTGITAFTLSAPTATQIQISQVAGQFKLLGGSSRNSVTVSVAQTAVNV